MGRDARCCAAWWLSCASVVLLGLAGCSVPATSSVRGGTGSDIRTAQAEAYDGPKARIAVAGFEDKMLRNLYFRPVYGIGMQDMLSTALFNTGRYIVLEREKLQAVLHEQDLGRIGRVRRETAAPIGEIEGAELLVQGAITGFDPGNSGAAAGLGKAIGGEILGDVAQIAGSVTPEPMSPWTCV